VSSSVLQSRRLAAVQTPVIPIISRWTAETPGTISLGQGIVGYGPPPEAIEAARRFGGALDDHRYGPVEGQPALVDALEHKLSGENGIRVRPASRLVVTAGGNLAFMNAALAITDPGDEVIFPAPFYFNHEMAVMMAGARPVPVPTTREYQLDVDAIGRAIGDRTRAVVTVSPNNPTGAVYSEESLRAVNALCRERRVFHIHDETYEYFTYDQTPHFSPGSIEGASAYTISLFSMSKAYGMASWRVGYMVIPESLWDAINKIQDTLLICAPVVSQVAAVAALGIGRAYAASKIGPLAEMRQTIGRALDDPAVPCAVAPAPGAFYFFVRVFTPYQSLDLTERLIREHRVAVVPGSAFGGDECSIRVSYGALDPSSANEGSRRLVRGLQELAAT
jgi:aspartate/methionine/tyrosine aminotransferase